MIRVKYSTEDIMAIAAFEKLTRTKVVDYIDAGDIAYFLVDAPSVAGIIGKNGSKIRTIERVMGRKVKVFRYSKDLEQFVRNLLLVEVKDTKVLKNDGKIIVKVQVDRKYRPMLVGRDGKNINAIREFLRRWFKVHDIKLE